MSVTLLDVTKNTRGRDSREINYKVIGKYIPREVERETEPVLNEDGTPKLDADGDPVTRDLGKDANGKQITRKETVNDLVTDGVLTDIGDALELVGGNEQELLNCFVVGFNSRSYEAAVNTDEFAQFYKDLNLDDEKAKVFARTARQLAKNNEITNVEAAEAVADLMKRKMAKAAQ